ncbi:Alpha/beta knot methyltransferase [Phytophthora cactorum]|nr:Alpha/beta knot methyltransferase [Phytophthora cactorum]
MLVSASAFGVKEVFVVGQKKFDLQEQEPFLSSLSCRVTRVATLKDCRALCQERGIRIVGVEIMHDAKSIADQPFSGDTALSWATSGMNSAQVAICDDFVYIPQYGGGTASLNVTVAASIILQSFALWAKLPTVGAVNV